MSGDQSLPLQACLTLVRAVSRAEGVPEICDAVLSALDEGLGVHQSTVILVDEGDTVRCGAARDIPPGLEAALHAVPWHVVTDTAGPRLVSQLVGTPAVDGLRLAMDTAGIADVLLLPLAGARRMLGALVVCLAAAPLPPMALQVATLMAAQVAFALERARIEAQERRHERRLRFALASASMGTWEWDLATNSVEWSDNLASLHGLTPGTFDGTFASYEREIHPEDRAAVFASVQRALAGDGPHDVEYRIVAPDGTVRWVEGKGQVERVDGVPVRMSGVCIMATRRKEAELARFAAAEEVSRAKDAFLATLSHELRTPLNAIMGWVQLAKSADLPPERLTQAIATIERNATLQAQLIEDILDVSRIIAGKLDIQRVPLDLGALIDTAVQGLMPAADAKGVRVRVEVDAALPTIDGEARRLLQVLGNLLSNALKFTDAGGDIHLRCAGSDEAIRLAITDTGQGIDPTFLPRVFDRFQQGETGTARRQRGLGLGLAIVKHLVEQHGGQIVITSPGLGLGTCATVTLPASRPTSLPSEGETEVSVTLAGSRHPE